MAENKTVYNGVGLGTIVFVVFLTLKLAVPQNVPWLSWFWVFFPLWIGPAVVLAICIVVLAVCAYLDRKK